MDEHAAPRSLGVLGGPASPTRSSLTKRPRRRS